MKRIKSAVVSGCLVFSLFSIQAFAANVGVFLDSNDGSSLMELKGPNTTRGITLDSASGIYAKGSYNVGLTRDPGIGSVMMWLPKKSAFRAGYAGGTTWNDVNVGSSSVAFGDTTRATGTGSTAFGFVTTASGTNSTALGERSYANGDDSVAMGYYATAGNLCAVAMGANTYASGQNAVSMGGYTTAAGFNAVSMGYYTSAAADYSVAMGRNCSNGYPYSLGIGNAGTMSAPDILFNPEGDCWINPATGGLGVGANGGGGYRLYVTDNSGGYVAYFYNSDTTSNADGIRIRIGPTDQSLLGANNNFLLFEDGDGTDLGAVEGIGGLGVNYKSGGGDYAEYFDAEEAIAPGYLTGLNPSNGKARTWQKGDPLLGIISTAPAFTGNVDFSDTNKKTVLVALVGQVDLKDRANVVIEGIKVSTVDGQKIGYLLSNGKVFISKN